jgi:hypothetical protein
MSSDFLSKLQDTDVSLWSTGTIRNPQFLLIVSSDAIVEANTEKGQYVHVVVSWMDWREILQG